MASTDLKTEANDAVSNAAAETEGVDRSETETLTEPAVKETKALIQQKLNSAKRVLSDRLMKPFFHGDRTTRLYHVWPGNNVQLRHAQPA